MASEKRLVSADELKGEFMFLRKMWSATEISAAIDEQPTVDAVEVVRCKDCKHWEKGNPKTYFLDCGSCWKCMLKTHQDHFCSYGERKDNGSA